MPYNINKRNLPVGIQSSKAIAIFAFYSKDAKIHNYTIYYLKELKKVVDAIVFVADNELAPTEIVKLEGIVIHSLCKRHGCYDFGSYKRGFLWAEENALLNDAEELIFCNDSCYGPVYPFQEVFDVMQDCEEDFWGMTHPTQIKEHLQSFFLVFKRKVFSSDAFKTFVESFKKQDSYEQYVLNYELNFTEILDKAGFKHTSYLKKQPYVEVANIVKNYNPTIYPITLLHAHMPLVKKKDYSTELLEILKELLEDLQREIAIANATLYNIICNDIKDYLQCNDIEDYMAYAKTTFYYYRSKEYIKDRSSSFSDVYKFIKKHKEYLTPRLYAKLMYKLLYYKLF